MNFDEVRWRQLERLFQFAVLAVFAALAISLTVAAGRFKAAFNQEALKVAPYPQLSFLLMVATCVLIALWYFAVSSELEVLRQYGKEFIPSLPDVRLQALGFSVLLGLLAYFADRLVIYAAIYSTFKLFEVWILWARDQKLTEALQVARSKSDPNDPGYPAWEIMNQSPNSLPENP